jgi:type II secretory pathway predicted ATPase ExeA
MYFEYWGLERNPFDSVPDPDMYFRLHQTAESAVAEVLFAIEEGNECLAVVVGEVGLGKTMALRVLLDSLDPEQYRIAFVTNPEVTFTQLMREIIGQLCDEPCSIRDKVILLEEFNRILFDTADSGRKVLIFIDEGNSIKAANLEALRLLTNMQEDTRNLFTIVLAGQPRLGRMLEAPERANLFQRIGVYCKLEPFHSAEVVKDYIEHRLERSGRTERIFTDDAYHVVFEHSKGTPRLINRLCKLALKAGETHELERIDAALVRQIASRFERKYAMPERDESPMKPAAEQYGDQFSKPLRQESVASQVFETRRQAAGGNNGGGATPVSFEEVRQRNAYQARVRDPWAFWKIPPEVLERARQLPDRESRLRLAGQLAARELQEHPEKFESYQGDPIQVWDRLRSEILNSFPTSAG